MTVSALIEWPAPIGVEAQLLFLELVAPRHNVHAVWVSATATRIEGTQERVDKVVAWHKWALSVEVESPVYVGGGRPVGEA